MNIWGVGIFDNDLAVEIRKVFEAGLAGGQSVFMVSEQIIEKYSETNSGMMYLVLAALQLEHNLIQQKVRKRALTYIISGDAAERWEGIGNAVYENRLAALQDLRKRLVEMH